MRRGLCGLDASEPDKGQCISILCINSGYCMYIFTTKYI